MMKKRQSQSKDTGPRKYQMFGKWGKDAIVELRLPRNAIVYSKDQHYCPM